MSENTAYDPSAPEGASSPGSQYLSRKDAKWLIGATIIVGIGLIPVYLYLRDKAWKSSCIKNMSGMMEAITIYAANSDDRMPPLYNTDDNGEPFLDKQGLPYTWISDIKPYSSDRISFICPAAKPEEIAYSVDANTGEPLGSTYGFYAPYATATIASIDDPNNVILLVETSNKGSQGSYDPLKFKSGGDDGFVVGWDNNNFAPDKETQAVTRLAFRGTSNGSTEKGFGRHEIIHGITASRQQKYLKPSMMLTEYNPATYSLAGSWRQPLILKGNSPR
jgi:hypothetical protein